MSSLASSHGKVSFRSHSVNEAFTKY